MTASERLFSYGTLRDPAVQRALFGRLIDEQPDNLCGYVRASIVIDDDDVVRLSGETRHVILHPSGDPADEIAGAVLCLTPAELAIADDYETAAYHRIEVALRSGRTAFVYVAADPVAGADPLG